MSASRIWYCLNCGYEIEHRGRCHHCKARLVASPLAPLSGLDEDDEVGYRLGNWSEQARGRLIVALIRANVEHRFDEEELVVAVDDEDKVDDLLAELQTVLSAEGIEVIVEDDEDDDDEEDDDDADDASDEDDEADEDEDEDDADEDDDKDEAPARVAPAALTGTIPSEEELDDLALDPVQASVALLYDAAKRLRSDPTDMQADGDVAEASAGVFADEDVVGVDPDTWAAIGRVTRRLLGALGAEEALEDEIRTQAGVLTKLLQPYVELDFDEFDGEATTTAELLAQSTAAVPEGRFDHGRAHDEEDLETSADPAADDDVLDDELLDEDDDLLDQEDDDEDLGEDEVVDESAEIVYELPEWLPEQRANLSVLLDEEGIGHSWDGTDLVIAARAEAAVDAIFDRIEDQEPVADGEERYRAIEQLFASADRLAGDPESPTRRDDLLQAFVATEGPSPVGMPDAIWWQIRARARTLVDDLDTGSAPSRVREDASALRDLLRTVV